MARHHASMTDDGNDADALSSGGPTKRMKTGKAICRFCNLQAQKGGVCFQHGAVRKKCKKRSCYTDARGRNGLCTAHGGRNRFIVPGCEKQEVKYKKCKSHGPRCTYKTSRSGNGGAGCCTTWAKVDGMWCEKHYKRMCEKYYKHKQ